MEMETTTIARTIRGKTVTGFGFWDHNNSAYSPGDYLTVYAVTDNSDPYGTGVPVGYLWPADGSGWEIRATETIGDVDDERALYRTLPFPTYPTREEAAEVLFDWSERGINPA
jgi:hypothetical protein